MNSKSKLIFFVLFLLTLILIVVAFYVTFSNVVVPRWNTLIIPGRVVKISVMTILSIWLIWLGIVFLSKIAKSRIR